MYYIRFTEDIYTDFENGNSYTNQGVKLDGICAFTIRSGNLHEYSSEEEILEAAKEDASLYARAYDYARLVNGNYAVLKGEYVSSNNDGVLISVSEIISRNESV